MGLLVGYQFLPMLVRGATLSPVASEPHWPNDWSFVCSRCFISLILNWIVNEATGA